MEENNKLPEVHIGGRRLVIAAYDVISVVVVALISLILIATFLVRVVGVSGSSMQPTLNNGDRLLLANCVTTFERGDIVVIDRYTEEPLIKRVIAVGGDTINIMQMNADSVVLVNGQIQYEPYIQGITVKNDFDGEMLIPEGYYFVMGDNRTPSKDSRMDEIGLISEKDIAGKVLYCVWPVSAIGNVYD